LWFEPVFLTLYEIDEVGHHTSDNGCAIPDHLNLFLARGILFLTE
jgi:hypothetical protein